MPDSVMESIANTATMGLSETMDVTGEDCLLSSSDVADQRDEVQQSMVNGSVRQNSCGDIETVTSKKRKHELVELNSKHSDSAEEGKTEEIKKEPVTEPDMRIMLESLQAEFAHRTSEKAQLLLNKLMQNLQAVESETASLKSERGGLNERLKNLAAVTVKMDVLLKKREKLVDTSQQTDLIETGQNAVDDAQAKQGSGRKVPHNLPAPSQGVGQGRAPSSQAARGPPPSANSSPAKPSPPAASPAAAPGNNGSKAANVMIDLTSAEEQQQLLAATQGTVYQQANSDNNGSFGATAVVNKKSHQQPQQYSIVGENPAAYTLVTHLDPPPNQPQYSAGRQTASAPPVAPIQQPLLLFDPNVSVTRAGVMQQQMVAPVPTPMQPVVPPHLSYPPAPVPPNPGLMRGMGYANTIPTPVLTVDQVPEGVCLQWDNPRQPDLIEPATFYEVHSYASSEVDLRALSSSVWKKVGDVSALPLPMACTLTQVQRNNAYYFIVRAIDRHHRYSNWSNVARVMIN